MPLFLGVDTSNYSTSLAVFDGDEDKIIYRRSERLKVKQGEIGLRQNDAVFEHVKNLPVIFKDLFSNSGFPNGLDALNISGIGVSNRPSWQEGSYMPCFLSGESQAEVLAATLGIPVYKFSHQQGHVAAVLYGSARRELLNEEFYAFHVSGGTTDMVHVKPSPENIIDCFPLAKSLDLKAGQLIDRVAKMLELPFPGGPYLEKLALSCEEKISLPKISMKEGDCCLSGIENLCEKLVYEGFTKEYIAKYCLLSVLKAVENMTRYQLNKEPFKVVYAGGVMSNSIIKKHLEDEFGGIFADPEFSADNAVGIAFMAYLKSLR